MAKVGTKYTVLVNFEEGKVKILDRKPASVNRGWEIPEGMMNIAGEKALEYIRAWSHILKPIKPDQVAAIKA